jgi:hypothetical protein
MNAGSAVKIDAATEVAIAGQSSGGAASRPR